MSRSVNKVILVGNLTNGPQLKETASGQKLVTFTIATNRQWVSNGEKKTQTEFTHISGWGNLAEISNNFLDKGKLVYIEGYLHTMSWKTEEGVPQQRTEVVMQDMIILTPRKKGGEEEASANGGSYSMEGDSFDPDAEDQAA